MPTIWFKVKELHGGDACLVYFRKLPSKTGSSALVHSMVLVHARCLVLYCLYTQPTECRTLFGSKSELQDSGLQTFAVLLGKWMVQGTNLRQEEAESACVESTNKGG